MINQIKLARKFNCKKKLSYRNHLLLMLRTQLIFELIILVTNCIANLSFRFHLSHVLTTEFWTSEKVASSNFSLALTSLILVVYTVKF